MVSVVYDTLPLTETENYRFELSMLAMAVLGLGEILGGLSMGIIVDRIGPKRASFWTCFLIVL